MATPRNEADAAGSLDILGIGEAEERAYRWLLTHSGATSQETAQTLALASRKAQQVLDTLEAKGLTTHSPERPRRYIPVSPDLAMGALILQRQKDLQDAQLTVQSLQERASEAQHSGGREQMVELITSREAERRILEQMERTVQDEFITLMRPPMRISRLDVPAEEANPAQGEGQARGVHYRSVVDAEFMELPGALESIRSDMKAGEEIRVIPNLPLKLILADRRLAIIPLNLRQLDAPALLVRSSTLLDALYALVELIWERASPISFSAAGVKTDDFGSSMDEQVKELISLMAAGLNDKNISHELGISRRTHQRHVTELMHLLNARTRFQTGWLAALRLSAMGAIPGVQGSSQK